MLRLLCFFLLPELATCVRELNSSQGKKDIVTLVDLGALAGAPAARPLCRFDANSEPPLSDISPVPAGSFRAHGVWLKSWHQHDCQVQHMLLSRRPGTT